MKDANSLGSVDLNDLCIHQGLKFTPKFKYLNFKKNNGKGCPYTHLKLYGTGMAQYNNDDKLLVQTVPLSFTKVALSWITRIEISNIKL